MRLKFYQCSCLPLLLISISLWYRGNEFFNSGSLGLAMQTMCSFPLNGKGNGHFELSPSCWSQACMSCFREPGPTPVVPSVIKIIYKRQMSRVVRKPAFCICENKDADQLRSNREADQRLCFRYTDSTIPLLSKSEISSL